MRVALIIPSLLNRGPIVFTRYLVTALTRAGVEVEIFYFAESNEIDFNVPMHRIGFLDVVDFSSFDIVNSTMLKADLYLSLYPNSYIYPAKKISSLHNYIVEDLGFLYRRPKSILLRLVWILALKSIGNLVVSTDYMKIYYEKLLGNKNFGVIPYGIDDQVAGSIDESDFKFLTGLSVQYKLIGSVGLVIVRKGFEQLINLLVVKKNCAVVIIGEGPDRERLETIATQKGVSERFFIMGFKAVSKAYYKYFDLYAHVSYSEGFGLAMLEAMAAGLPVVCSRLPIYKGLLSEDEVAYYDPDDIPGLICSVSKVLDNRPYYVDSSVRLFRNKFQADEMAYRHIKYYESLL